MTTAERLTYLRKKANLTQAELGQEILYSSKAVHTWEIGQKLPGYDAIIALAKFYGVSADYILCLTESEK